MAEELEGSPEEVEKVTNFIDSRVQSQVEARVRAALAEMQAQEQPQRQSDQDEGQRRLREVIEPIYRPEINEARIDALSATDENRFYRRNAEAIEYEAQIEDVFEKSRKAGRPMIREDIYSYILGKEVRSNTDSFVEKHNAKKAAQLDKARGGVDMGFSSLSKDKQRQSLAEFSKLSSDDMAKELEGVEF
jgi:hypothetical protein